ncbi:MAG: RluA family pseudouridine synthase [Bacteroidota bacterium]
MFLHETIHLPAGQRPFRLDKFLTGQLPNVSRTRIQAGIKESNILVNEKNVKASYAVRPFDTIQILLPYPPRDEDIAPEDLPLDIVYEDAHLLVVNKAAPMVVHPGHANWTGTLVNALLYHIDHLSTTTDNPVRAGLVHRIDKGTSGLLVVGKTEESLAHLAGQFYHRTVNRRYLALIWGNLKEDEGTVSVPLGRSPKDRRVMTAYPEGEGKHAVTHYQVIKRYSYTTLITCKLETGRTHQIRAHMKHIGHPLFGDPRYGGDTVLFGPRFSKYLTFVKNGFSLLPHQALHATSLEFVHPATGQVMTFEVPPPDNFQRLLDKWERYNG